MSDAACRRQGGSATRKWYGVRTLPGNRARHVTPIERLAQLHAGPWLLDEPDRAGETRSDGMDVKTTLGIGPFLENLEQYADNAPNTDLNQDLQRRIVEI